MKCNQTKTNPLKKHRRVFLKKLPLRKVNFRNKRATSKGPFTLVA